MVRARVRAAWVVAAIHYRLYDLARVGRCTRSHRAAVAVLAVGTSKMARNAGSTSGRCSSSRASSRRSRRRSCSRVSSTTRGSTLNKVRWWLPLVHRARAVRARREGTRPRHRAVVPGHARRDVLLAGMPLGRLLLGLSPVFNVALFFVTGSIWWFVALFAGAAAFARGRRSRCSWASRDQRRRRRDAAADVEPHASTTSAAASRRSSIPTTTRTAPATRSSSPRSRSARAA